MHYINQNDYPHIPYPHPEGCFCYCHIDDLIRDSAGRSTSYALISTL